jgi:hypothetical protein
VFTASVVVRKSSSEAFYRFIGAFFDLFLDRLLKYLNLTRGISEEAPA